MRGWAMTPEGHDAVSAAVTEAERASDGEIVTIVSASSDAYHDVGLHYAVLAMLTAPIVAALFPGWIEALANLLHGGWTAEGEARWTLLATVIAQTIAFLVVRYALAWPPLRMALTPGATKARRVRRRAIQLFRASAEQRTAARVGVLLYVSIAERKAEIVADEAIASRVAPDVWGDAMAALIERLRVGDAGGGMAAAVTRIGAVLAEHFPKTEADVNELPDRLIEL